MLAPTAALLLLGLAPAALPAPEPLGFPEGPLSSLLGGEVLPVGNSVLTGYAGYPALGFLYGQGFGGIDAGGELQLRWDTGELVAAGLTRLPIWRDERMALAFRARAGLYACFAASYGSYAGRGDTGLLLAPGLVLSTSAGRGLVSASLDLWSAFTGARGGGVLLAPQLGAAVEVPLVGDLTIGARIGLAHRWDRGGAPGSRRSPETGAELVALLGYRLL
jgi:hypothetical protein